MVPSFASSGSKIHSTSKLTLRDFKVILFICSLLSYNSLTAVNSKHQWLFPTSIGNLAVFVLRIQLIAEALRVFRQQSRDPISFFLFFDFYHFLLISLIQYSRLVTRLLPFALSCPFPPTTAISSFYLLYVQFLLRSLFDLLVASFCILFCILKSNTTKITEIWKQQSTTSLPKIW